MAEGHRENSGQVAPGGKVEETDQSDDRDDLDEIKFALLRLRSFVFSGDDTERGFARAKADIAIVLEALEQLSHSPKPTAADRFSICLLERENQ